MGEPDGVRIVEGQAIGSLEHIRSMDYEIFKPVTSMEGIPEEYSNPEQMSQELAQRLFSNGQKLRGFLGTEGDHRGMVRFAINGKAPLFSPRYEIIQYRPPSDKPDQTFYPQSFLEGNQESVFEVNSNYDIFAPENLTGPSEDVVCPNLIKKVSDSGEVVVLRNRDIPVKEVYALKEASIPDISQVVDMENLEDSSKGYPLATASYDFLRGVEPQLRGEIEVLTLPSKDRSVKNSMYAIEMDGKGYIVVQSESIHGSLPEIRVFESPRAALVENSVVHNPSLIKLGVASLKATQEKNVPVKIRVKSQYGSEYLEYKAFGHDKLESLQVPSDQDIFGNGPENSAPVSAGPVTDADIFR